MKGLNIYIEKVVIVDRYVVTYLLIIGMYHLPSTSNRIFGFKSSSHQQP